MWVTEHFVMCTNWYLCCTWPQGVQQLHLLDCGGSLPTALLRSLPLVAITIVRSDLASAEEAWAAARAANAEAPVDHVLHAAGSWHDWAWKCTEVHGHHGVSMLSEQQA